MAEWKDLVDKEEVKSVHGVSLPKYVDGCCGWVFALMVREGESAEMDCISSSLTPFQMAITVVGKQQFNLQTSGRRIVTDGGNECGRMVDRWLRRYLNNSSRGANSEIRTYLWKRRF